MGYEVFNLVGWVSPYIYSVEHLSPKAEVTGSTPVGCTNIFNDLDIYDYGDNFSSNHIAINCIDFS